MDHACAQACEMLAGRDGEDAWKNKDVVVYLFEAVATRSGMLAVIGATVEVVSLFKLPSLPLAYGSVYAVTRVARNSNIY